MPLVDARGGFPRLKITTRYSIALPCVYDAPEGGWPVLWLLADDGGLYSDWVRRTAVESFAEELGIAVVMPEGLHSDYEDMKRGLDWNTFVFDELPAYLQGVFPLSADPKKQFVFGAGMGGLGAIRQALRDPAAFAAAGAVDTDFNGFDTDARHTTPAWEHRMATIYGDDFRAAEILARSDPRQLAAQAVATLYLGKTGNDPEQMDAFAALLGDKAVMLTTERTGWAGREALLRQFMEVCARG